MEDLIKALKILLKYGNPKYPTHCEHDELNIVGIDPKLISEVDKKELEELGFLIEIEGVWNEENQYEGEDDKICSYRYGSA